MPCATQAAGDCTLAALQTAINGALRDVRVSERRNDALVLHAELRSLLEETNAQPLRPVARAQAKEVAASCYDLAFVIEDELTDEGTYERDRAVAAGAIETLVDVFRTFAAHAAPLGAAGLALFKLLKHGAGCAKADAAGALSVVVAALCAHGADAQTQIACMRIVDELINSDSRNSLKAGRLGAVDAVVAALCTDSRGDELLNIESAAVIVMGALALQAENCAKAHRIDAVAHVTAAMRRHRNSAPAQRFACRTLAVLLVVSHVPPERVADVRAKAITAGVAEAVAYAMCMLADDADAQQEGTMIMQFCGAQRRRVPAAAACSGAENLTSPDGTAASAASAALPADELDEAAQLLQHNDDADAQKSVLEAMYIRWFDVATPAASSGGGNACRLPVVGPAMVVIVDAVLTVLRSHGAHAGVQLWGMRVLSTLLDSAAGPSGSGPGLHLHAAASSGGVEAIAEAMQVHRTDVQVQAAGCQALGSVVDVSGGDEMLAHGFSATSAVDAVHAALRMHAADPHVQLHGFAALLALSTVDANAPHSMIRAGVPHLPPLRVRNPRPKLVQMRAAVMRRLRDAGAAAAEAAAAELLASEEAERAAGAAAAATANRGGGGGSSKKSKKQASKKNRGAAGAPPPVCDATAAAMPAPAPTAAGPQEQDVATSAAGLDDSDAAAAALSSSSANAARRRRRSAAKATRRGAASSSTHAAAAGGRSRRLMSRCRRRRRLRLLLLLTTTATRRLLLLLALQWSSQLTSHRQCRPSQLRRRRKVAAPLLLRPPLPMMMWQRRQRARPQRRSACASCAWMRRAASCCCRASTWRCARRPAAQPC
jgi:hypothetical protein